MAWKSCVKCELHRNRSFFRSLPLLSSSFNLASSFPCFLCHSVSFLVLTPFCCFLPFLGCFLLSSSLTNNHLLSFLLCILHFVTLKTIWYVLIRYTLLLPVCMLCLIRHLPVNYYLCQKFFCQAQKYWVCSFSNNQWQLNEELGDGSGWQQCSFYLALRSGHCLGTTMVFDDDAMPLERSRCLFELLQTFQSSQDEQQFQGLFLCTPSGVLNTGMCSIDAALGIAQKLSDLKLPDARATLETDKQMIDT